MRDMSRVIWRRCLAAIVGIASSSWLLVTATTAQADGWPTFRKGLWQFEHTLALTRKVDEGEGNPLVFKREMKRCVDPSEAMKETFRPLSVGNCHSMRPERVANKYVFALRCDYMGPVRTTIEVESDGAYTEVNELQVGPFPRKDTIVARRIAECD